MKAFRLFLLLLMSCLALAGMLIYQARTGALTVVSTEWNKLPDASRQLINALLVVLFGVTGTLLAYLQLRHMRRPPPRKLESPFAFDRFSTSDIRSLEEQLLGKYADLEYQPRFPPSKQSLFEARLDTKLLILTGRTGLGKTRECIELFKRLAQTKGEDITVLCPHEDFDRPADRAIPPDLAPRNLVLFIDDIDQRCIPPSSDPNSADAHTRTFHDRLSATIAWMRERYAGRDWRVVLTARDEPDLRTRLHLGATVWSGFTQFQLPGVHSGARAAFIRAVASHFLLEIEEGAINHIAVASDGTCAGIITALARESARRSGHPGALTLKDLEQYEFRYPADWERNVYKKAIAPYPDRRSVFEALSGLNKLSVPAHGFLVVDLAARLCQWNRPRWLKKKLIRRAIRRDLRAWMYESHGYVICPAAYIEGRVDVPTVLPQVLSSLRDASGKKEQIISLLPALPEISRRLGRDFGRPDEALSLLEAGTKQAPGFASIWISMAGLLSRQGRDQESLRAAEAACRADNQSAAALVALAYAQGRTGSEDQAVRTAREAASLTPNTDFVWLNLGVALSKRGLHEEAVAALRRASELNPQSAKAWYSLGVAYGRSDQYDKAIDVCKHATDLDPLNAGAWHALGIAYSNAGETGHALAALRRAQQFDNGNAKIWLSLSRTLFFAGRTEEALVSLREAAACAAADSHLLSRVSAAYGRSHRYLDAVQAAERALRINPKRSEAWCTLAVNLASLPGREEEAQKARVRVGEFASTADDWAALSVVYGKVAHREEAVTAARKAINIDAKHSKAWCSLAINLARQPGGELEALQALARVRELARTADDWFALSRAYGKAGYREDAVTAARKAIDINPRHSGAWRSLAMNLAKAKWVAEVANTADFWSAISVVFGKAGHHEEAVATARKAIDIDPRHSHAWCSLAINLVNQSGRQQEALQALARVEKLASTADDWFDLSVAYGKAGHHAGAVTAARRAIDISPEHSLAWRSLAINLANLPGREEEAQKARVRVREFARSAADWVALSVTYGRDGHCEDAVTAARKAIGINPKHSGAWRSLAMNLANLPAREQEALAARNRIAEMAENADDWFGLGVVYGKAGYYAKSIEAASRAIALDRDHVDSWRIRAINLDQLGRSDEALIAWKRVDELTGTDTMQSNTVAADTALREVEANPASPAAWKRFASTYRLAGRSVEALSVARSEVQRSPQLAPHISAIVDELLSQEPRLVAILMEDLVSLNPQNPYYRHLLGIARRKAGDLNDAVEALQAACNLDPNEENYWYALGRAFETLGNRAAAARDAYERALQLKPHYTKARLALGRLTTDDLNTRGTG